MNNRKKYMILALVVVFVLCSFAACMPTPARKPTPNTTNNYTNYTRNTTTPPYTAQNNTTTNRSVGTNYTGTDRNVGTNNTTNSSGGQISAVYSTLDNSCAQITGNTKIRTGPSTATGTIGNLKAGDQVKVIGKLKDWYVVNVPNTAKLGCISPDVAQLYSAEPNSTTPAPTKTIPTTPTNLGTGTGTTPGLGTGTGTTPGFGTGTATPAPAKTPGATGATGTLGSAGTTGTSTAAGSGTLSAQGSRILQLVNAERAKVGAPALKANTELNKLATMKSQDMVEKNYFSHQSPTYGSPFDMMKTYGVSYMYAGENIAINSDADRVHQAWMNSEGHRKNILNPDFTEIGIGLYPKGNGQYTYTQMFIGK